MKTLSLVILFAAPLFAGSVPPRPPSAEHQNARRLMDEASRTTNPIRLLFLAMNIKDSLDKALAEDPENVEVRLDLVRYYTVTPGVMGGSIDEARAHAREIGRRDPPLGHFAHGYIAYREKELGTARHELREAVRTAQTPSTRALSLRWLGWLSQESQQWDEAFAVFEELGDRYEIGRTAVFCGCRLEPSKAALQSYVRTQPRDAAAHLQLALLHETLGELAAAKREVQTAWRLDRTLTGLKKTRKRLGVR